MFKKDFTEASVSRLGYVTTWGYKKSAYTSTSESYIGNLKALSIKDGVEVWSFGKEFQFNTDIVADIRESDRLTINGEVYDVKWVAPFNGVTFSRKMVILHKNDNPWV